MHTKDMLADALQAIGLTEMSEKARAGYYHDFLSPLELPQIALVNQLNIEAGKHPDRQPQIIGLCNRVIAGHFDASDEESDDWADSPEAQAAFQSLMKR